MQIHNFYADPMPSVRNPLDSIVLSPHTMQYNEFSLDDAEADACDYRSLLPSPSSCKYYYYNTGRRSNASARYIWGRCWHIISLFGRRKA